MEFHHGIDVRCCKAENVLTKGRSLNGKDILCGALLAPRVYR